MSNELALTENMLPLAAQYPQHESLAVVMPEKGAIVTIYEPNTKSGVLIPIHDDARKYDTDIVLTTNVLNNMNKHGINMSNVKVTISSNDSKLADLVKNNLPSYSPEIINNKYGQVLRFHLEAGSITLVRQIDQQPMSQQPKGQPPEQQYQAIFQYH